MSKYFKLDEIPFYRFQWYGRIPLEIWRPLKQYVYERDKGICQKCKKQFKYEDTHCHHVLELSEGGTNHPSNLKTVCVPCHEEIHPYMKNMW